ncbi:MAG: hypothetical protein SOT45_08520, partial [Treponema sp.]|nr:hypothetical protein [Treponema sp.]
LQLFYLNFLYFGAVPKVMSVALIELVEMTATLNVVVSINSTTVMQTYWTAPLHFLKLKINFAKLSFIMKIGEGRKRLTKTSAGRKR